MSITRNLNYTKPQLKRFSKLLKAGRKVAGLSQLQLAQKAFEYEVSHCKVSRIERAAMPLVDAHCLERMARVLRIPRALMLDIDPAFDQRTVIFRAATGKGFWHQGHARAKPMPTATV